MASRLERTADGWRGAGQIDVQVDVRRDYLTEQGRPRRFLGEVVCLIVGEEMLTIPADQMREALCMQPAAEMPSHETH